MNGQNDDIGPRRMDSRQLTEKHRQRLLDPVAGDILPPEPLVQVTCRRAEDGDADAVAFEQTPSREPGDSSRCGEFEIRGEAEVMGPLDRLLADFADQGRMKLPGSRYEPCYRLAG
jgi:hypothetical protein